MKGKYLQGKLKNIHVPIFVNTAISMGKKGREEKKKNETFKTDRFHIWEREEAIESK